MPVGVWRSTAADDAGARARFEREPQSISQLNHPHICAVYDVGRHRFSGAPGEDVDFLVMEYLDGESLAARLERGPLPPDEALDYAMQIADAPYLATVVFTENRSRITRTGSRCRPGCRVPWPGWWTEGARRCSI